MVAFFSPAISAEFLSKSVVDGKIVLLYSDNTWEYEDKGIKASNGCVILSKTIKFCDNKGDWKATKGQPDHLAAYVFDSKNYGVIIEENLGSSDGVTLETMRAVVISNVESLSGVTKDDIVIVSVENVTLFDQDAVNMVYMVTYKGLKFFYSNTILVLPNDTYQLLTYLIGKKFTENDKKLHDQFVGLISVTP